MIFRIFNVQKIFHVINYCFYFKRINQKILSTFLYDFQIYCCKDACTSKIWSLKFVCRSVAICLGLASIGALEAASTSPELHQEPNTTSTYTESTTQTVGSTKSDGRVNLSNIKEKTKSLRYPKLGSSLNAIVEEYGTPQVPKKAASRGQMSVAPQKQAQPPVPVFIQTDTRKSVDSIVRFLEDNDISPSSVWKGDSDSIIQGMISVWVPILLLVRLSEQPGVLKIWKEVLPAPHQTQSPKTPAAIHRATMWHTTGIRGDGVRVGVIDLGFKNFVATIPTNLATPARALCFPGMGRPPTNKVSVCEIESNHGTNVTEALLHTAPNVSLYISNPGTQSELKDAVEWMSENNVQIINQSLSWTWDGPGDGTSPFMMSPLKTVDEAVDSGIIWFNSAGNHAKKTWFSRSGFTDPNGDNFLNFDSSDECNDVTLKRGKRYTFQLRWNDEWPRADIDLNLYLRRIRLLGNNEVVASSTDRQEGEDMQYPRETIEYTLPLLSFGVKHCLAIEHSRGDDPAWVQLQVWPSGLDSMEHLRDSGSITNPGESANPGMLAVGASERLNSFEIADYSSRGPTPDDRTKPDIVGTVNRFKGTSFASPHVAGLAALVIQRFQDDPNYDSPTEIANYLKNNALDRGILGPDNIWGYGFAQLPPISGPMAAGRIPDQKLRINDSPLIFFIDSYFDYPDKSRLSYSASINDTRVAMADINSNIFSRNHKTLEIRPISAGVATITITAREPGGLSDTQRFNVTVENEVQCTYSLSPTSRNLPPAADAQGGSQTVDVYITARPSNCSWRASSNNGFLSVSPSRGTGSNAVTVTVDENTSSNNRTGSVTVAERTFTVHQEGRRTIISSNWSVDDGIIVKNTCSSFPCLTSPFPLNIRTSANVPPDPDNNPESRNEIGEAIVGAKGTIKRRAIPNTNDGGFNWWEVEWEDSSKVRWCNDRRHNPSNCRRPSNNLGWSVDSFNRVALFERRPPDLEIRDFRLIGDDELEPGESFELSADVHNIDGSPSANTYLVFTSHNGRRSTDDFKIEAFKSLGRLIPGEKFNNVRETIDAPSSPGTYYYGAVTISFGDEEENAIDNFVAPNDRERITVLEFPDLVVVNIKVNDDDDDIILAPGESFKLSATVENEGDIHSESTTLHYYLSSDQDISRSDLEIETDHVGELSQSRDSNKFENIKAPQEEETYYYGACVDEVSDESNIGNNCSNNPVGVTVKEPDLIVENFSRSGNDSVLIPNQSFSLSITIRNQGQGPSGDTILRYYRSHQGDDLIVNDVISTTDIERLSGDSSHPDSIDTTAPSDGGIYYYEACVDDVTGESNRENNCSPEISVTVNGPPIATGTIAHQTVTVGIDSATVDITDKFSDPENDSLTYIARSSDTAIATAEISSSVVTIRPVATGNTVITVTASDGFSSAEQEIPVMVTTPQPPGTINICNRTLEVKTTILAIATVTETNCMAVPQTQLNTVTALNLSGSRSNLANIPRLSSLPPLMADDFSNLSNLQTLDLRYNDLTSLPTGIFNDVLDTLTNLEVDNNLKSTVTVEPRTANIVPGTTRTLTVRLTKALPVPIRLTITTDGTEASNIIAPTTVAISPGMTFSTFDITLAPRAAIGHTGIIALNAPAFLYASTTGNTLTNINPNVVSKLVRLDTATNAHTFTTIAQPLGAINICSRTPEVEAAILAEITETNCAFVPLVQLNTILELNLRNALSEATTTLLTGDFANLSNLQELRLGSNNLTSLHENLFDGLLNLQRLELDRNGLTLLHENLFGGLPNLQRLELNDNNLTLLHENLFDGLSNLQRLELDDNNLTSLHEDLFDGLSALRFLDLNPNNLTSLPTGIFNDVLATLTFLQLGTALKGTVSIEPRTANVTPGATRILTVQLNKTLPASVRFTIATGGADANNITAPATVTIPAGAMASTFNIILTAEAVSTGIVALHSPVILYADAMNNTQQNSNPDTINGLVNILDATANTFTFPVNATINICNRTPEVETAILNVDTVTETDCSTVPQTQLNTVTALNLDFIHPLMADDFTNLHNLQELNLTNNNLTSLHETLFDGLFNLQRLDLHSNNLTSLHENLFDELSNLRELHLNNNNLTLLHENLFDGLPNLQSLNLDGNNLTSLHENLFDGLSNLLYLRLNHNDLTSLHENLFDELSNLRELYLNNNNLHSLSAGIFNGTLNTLTFLTLDSQLRSTISIEPHIASVAPGATRNLIAQLTKPLPAAVRLTVTETGNITAPATIAIPAGMTSATFNITLAAEATVGSTGTVTLSAPVLLYTGTLGYTRANAESDVVFSLVNPLDAAANTFTFIAPDTTAGYDSTADITITEGGGTTASAERTLTLGYAPHAQATVSFELTGGTLGVRSVATNHDLIFTVGDGETDPAVGANGMTNGRFNIPAGTTSVILTFKAITDTDGDDETITFRITGIEFSDGGTATDIPTAALPSKLTIRIADAGTDAVVTVDDDDTSISELLPGSTGESAVVRVKLTNIPSTVTSAAIGFTLGGTATRGTDYTVTLVGSSTAADSVTITDADIAGTAPGVPQGGARGNAEATLTFHALNDSADIENENIVLTINSVTFEGAPASNLMSTDIAGNSQTITITDRPTSPRAVISVGEAKITEGDGLSENPNFRITFVNIDSSTPGATGMVNYTFNDGFSAAASPTPPECADGAGKYCAFSSISNSLAGLTNNTGSFSFTVSSINGVSAEISIFILPREDPDAEDETVELTINSITVPQSGGTLTFNMANGNLVNSDDDPTDKARITIADDALRLRIRVFLEGLMH